MSRMTRRKFLAVAGTAAAGASLNWAAAEAASEPIIDIHQHLAYGGKRDQQGIQTGPGRTDQQFVEHQRNMGATRTILLPAGRPCSRPSTHDGYSNGLESTCAGDEECAAFAKAHGEEYYFGANEVPDLEEAPKVIEAYLKRGAVVIGEQKFGVDCDSPPMRALYQLAADYKVPILMHWQFGSYNYGYERFDKMLAKFPKTIFVGHAQTFWANIDKNCKDDAKNLYPKGPVMQGGLTDRYLSDYPNFVGDLSADSGHNALTRDPDYTRGFIERHQDQLVFGSDCSDSVGRGVLCTGWKTIQTVRELAPSKAIERKLLYENAKRIYRLRNAG
jgi:predicted TIM-barrel fold metal-dependent hydrolase